MEKLKAIIVINGAGNREILYCNEYGKRRRSVEGVGDTVWK